MTSSVIGSSFPSFVAASARTCVGPVDEQAGTVSPPYISTWNSFPLRDHLEELTERPVTLASAGAAAAEAERLRYEEEMKKQEAWKQKTEEKD